MVNILENDRKFVFFFFGGKVFIDIFIGILKFRVRVIMIGKIFLYS